MPSPLTAYLAGVASVGVALAVGFGGALVVANAVMTDESTPPSKLERLAKHEPEPQAQTASGGVAFPVQASPVLVVPSAPVQIDQTPIAAAVQDVKQEVERPPAATLRESSQEANKKVEEEGRQASAPSKHSKKREPRADKKPKITATRWDKKRNDVAPADIPSKVMILQAPLDAKYENEDDDDSRIPLTGRLSFFEE
jgi:hypothetical protein